MTNEMFKRKCDKLTDLIESCWDENNPDDGLTFDERLAIKLSENPDLKKFSEDYQICD